MELSVNLLNQFTSEEHGNIKTIIFNSITKLFWTILKELTPAILEKSKEIIKGKLFTTT